MVSDPTWQLQTGHGGGILAMEMGTLYKSEFPSSAALWRAGG
jgi:hypothetical protein